MHRGAMVSYCVARALHTRAGQCQEGAWQRGVWQGYSCARRCVAVAMFCKVMLRLSPAVRCGGIARRGRAMAMRGYLLPGAGKVELRTAGQGRCEARRYVVTAKCS